MPDDGKPLFSIDKSLPELDFEVITLGHGSGGELTNQLLDAGVFKLFTNEKIRKRHDGVVIDIDGPVAFTTDSFVVSPVFFPGGNIGELGVNGTINDLAMCGATPDYLSLGLILEEGMDKDDLWKILNSAKSAAESAGSLIVTGDTKVVEKGKGDKIFVNTTGLGKVHPEADIDISRVKAGDKVIVSGSLANHGIAIMSVREGLEFESSIVSDTRNLNGLVMSILDEYGKDIHLLRDPTRGGVATVLNEIARQSGLGTEIHEDPLPVHEQVEGACEMLGLDPLYVANEGIFIAIVDPSVADGTVEVMTRSEEGVEAVIIGEMVEDHPGKVIMHSSIGGKRVVNMLPGEQLPRIC